MWAKFVAKDKGLKQKLWIRIVNNFLAKVVNKNCEEKDCEQKLNKSCEGKLWAKAVNMSCENKWWTGVVSMSCEDELWHWVVPVA